MLTFPSSKASRHRLLPFKKSLRTTGPALTTYLATKALLESALMVVHHRPSLKPSVTLNPDYLVTLFLAGTLVEIIPVIPAHIILTRLQANPIPANERTIVEIDWALRAAREGESDDMGMRDAWRSLGWDVWGRLIMLYGFVGALCGIGDRGLIVLDFAFFTMVGLMQLGSG